VVIYLKNKNIPIGVLGNFTKHAIENFEENIVNQRNYLEKVDKGLKNQNNCSDTSKK